jgi:hypothetical protein
MKPLFALLAISSCIISCEQKKTTHPLIGTWRLLSGTIIEKNDTTITDYTRDREFLKIINETHFAFVSHDLNKGKDSATAFYSSGGGSYTLKDSTYTENLQFCTAREWENNKFTFTVTITNDTLVQQGIERIEGTSIDRMNIEKYVRVKNQ